MKNLKNMLRKIPEAFMDKPVVDREAARKTNLKVAARHEMAPR